MDWTPFARRLRNSIEWSSTLAVLALGVNLALGFLALQGAKGSSSQSVLAYLGLVALAGGFFFFITLLLSPGLVDDEKPSWQHAVSLPLIFVAEVKTLLLLIGETRLSVRFFPEMALADKVANSPVALGAVALAQAAVLACWVWAGRKKPQ